MGITSLLEDDARCRSVPAGFSHVTEGKATILQQGNNVFYNKAQVVNRDVSLAVLHWFIDDKRQHPRKAKRNQKPSVPANTMLKVGMHCVAQRNVFRAAHRILHCSKTKLAMFSSMPNSANV